MQPKYDAIYRALVTSTTDATNSGKIRVQCPQIAGLAEIRAAEPINTALPVPKIGTTVWVMFSGGDITKPAYFSNTASQVLLKDWTSFTLISGFTDNGNSNGNVEYQVIMEFGSIKVNLQGGLGITYPSSTIANDGIWCDPLPNIITPTTSPIRTLTAACSLASSTARSLKIDFKNDNTAQIVGTNTTDVQPPWVSLNGLSYYL